jgi:hypothetical protein
MFTKTHCIIVLALSGTQDMTIVRTDIVPLKCTFTESLEEIVALISLNQFETYRKITPYGSVLLVFASWTQIK